MKLSEPYPRICVRVLSQVKLWVMTMGRTTRTVDNTEHKPHRCLPQWTAGTGAWVSDVGKLAGLLWRAAVAVAVPGLPQCTRTRTTQHSRFDLTAKEDWHLQNVKSITVLKLNYEYIIGPPNETLYHSFLLAAGGSLASQGIPCVRTWGSKS
jgi:hypothetical protein